MKTWTLDTLREARGELESLAQTLKLNVLDHGIHYAELLGEVEGALMRVQGYKRSDEELLGGDMRERVIVAVLLIDKLIESQMKSQELNTR